GWFNRSLDWLTRRYGTTTRWMVARSGRFMLLYLALLGGLGYALWRLPAGFVPIDDQGFVMADVLAPSDASANRTLDVVRSVEEQLAGTPGVDKL
ncbi:efflux RND transporter permease subunit, partial [Acinetobacter baumannii]